MQDTDTGPIDTDADTGGKTQREHKCDRYMCEHFHYCLAQLIYAIQLAFPDAQTDGRKEARRGGSTDRQTDGETNRQRAWGARGQTHCPGNEANESNGKLYTTEKWKVTTSLALTRFGFGIRLRLTANRICNGKYVCIYKYRNSNLVVVKHLWQITIHWAGLSSVSLGLCFCQLTVQCNRRLWSVCLCEHLVTTRAPLCVAPFPLPLPQPLLLRLRFGSISISSGLLNWGLSIKLN